MHIWQKEIDFYNLVKKPKKINVFSKFMLNKQFKPVCHNKWK